MGGEELSSFEVYWRDRYDFLESRGYLLRSRYMPGWIPSWTQDPNINMFKAEDAISWHVRSELHY